MCFGMRGCVAAGWAVGAGGGMWADAGVAVGLGFGDTCNGLG